MELHNLTPAAGSIKAEKRIGRGQGSGRGGTSTRGHKGAKSRSGYKTKIGFEQRGRRANGNAYPSPLFVFAGYCWLRPPLPLCCPFAWAFWAVGALVPREFFGWVQLRVR